MHYASKYLSYFIIHILDVIFVLFEIGQENIEVAIYIFPPPKKVIVALPTQFIMVGGGNYSSYFK